MGNGTRGHLGQILGTIGNPVPELLLRGRQYNSCSCHKLITSLLKWHSPCLPSWYLAFRGCDRAFWSTRHPCLILASCAVCKEYEQEQKSDHGNPSHLFVSYLRWTAGLHIIFNFNIRASELMIHVQNSSIGDLVTH